jgi:hypothetical protein
MDAKIVQYKQINKHDTLYQLNDKNNMIFSIDVKKAFNKIQYSFIIKALNKLGMKGTYLNLIKSIIM